MSKVHVDAGTVPGQTSGKAQVPTVSSEVTAVAMVFDIVVSDKSCIKGEREPLLSEPIRWSDTSTESQQTTVSSAWVKPTNELFIGAMIATKKIEANNNGRQDMVVTWHDQTHMAHNMHDDS